VEQQLKVQLDTKCLDLSKPVQTFGQHTVPLLLDPATTHTQPGTLSLKVRCVSPPMRESERERHMPEHDRAVCRRTQQRVRGS
jgi:hypothetical protein